MPKTKIEWTQSADGSAGYSWNPIQGTMGKSHRPHTTPGSRTPRQSEIHDMVDSVILAKFGGSFLDWLVQVRALGGVDKLPGQRITIAK